MPRKNLTTEQRRRAVAALARKRGIPLTRVTNAMVYAALDAGTITHDECGSSGSTDSGSFGGDCGTSSS